VSEMPTTPEGRARKRAEDLSGLLVHLAIYVVVNAFLWTMDLIGGGGLEWAYWATLGWGIGIAIHIGVFFFERAGFEEHKYEKYLAEEIERDKMMHR
jgi:hypothetical protein